MFYSKGKGSTEVIDKSKVVVGVRIAGVDGNSSGVIPYCAVVITSARKGHSAVEIKDGIFRLQGDCPCLRLNRPVIKALLGKCIPQVVKCHPVGGIQANSPLKLLNRPVVLAHIVIGKAKTVVSPRLHRALLYDVLPQTHLGLPYHIACKGKASKDKSR